MRSFPTEYLVLPRTSDIGPTIGYIGARPIAERVLDQWGQRYVYCGLAPRLPSGAINLKLIRLGEWIVEPGLLYRLDSQIGTGHLQSFARRELESSRQSTLDGGEE